LSARRRRRIGQAGKENQDRPADERIACCGDAVPRHVPATITATITATTVGGIFDWWRKK
jgi:hypothetical protein